MSEDQRIDLINLKLDQLTLAIKAIMFAQSLQIRSINPDSEQANKTADDLSALAAKLIA